MDDEMQPSPPSGLAVSPDGKYVVVGWTGSNASMGRVVQAFLDDNSLNYYYYYGKSVGDQFGKHISFSSSSSSNIWAASSSSKGYVRFFHSTSGQESSRPEIVGKVSRSHFGDSHALSDDGNTVVIGAPLDSSYGQVWGGSAHVFQYSPENRRWNAMGQILRGTTYKQMFGSCVCISSDAQIIGVASVGFDYNKGKVEVFSKSSSSLQTWNLLVSKIGDTENQYFGSSIDMSGSGDTIVIAAPTVVDNNMGKLFVLNSTTTTQLYEIPRTWFSIRYPNRVRISKDGKKIAAASLNADNDFGEVRVFSWNGAKWDIIHDNIIRGNFYRQYLGESMDLSDDGMTLAYSLRNFEESTKRNITVVSLLLDVVEEEVVVEVVEEEVVVKNRDNDDTLE